MRVGGPLVAKLLRLPEGTIVQPTMLTVSHPDIPDGAGTVEPQFRKHHTGRVQFLGWCPLPDDDPSSS